MNGEGKSEKPIEEKLKDLERQVKRLEEINFKYYFFGYIYFTLVLIILFSVPNYIGDTGSTRFNDSMSIFFFISAIIFALIFFVEIVYKFFRLMLKSEKSSS